MGTFKVGDWVRCVDEKNTNLVNVGDIYKIIGVNDRFVYIDDDVSGMLPRRFEPWTPKVGERVRVTYAGWEGDGEVYDLSLRYTSVTMLTGAKNGERGGFIIGQEVEPVIADSIPDPQPVAQPAQLNIQAGRYYRARNGRKVGPMEKYDEDSFSSFDDDNGMLWACTGERYFEYDRGGPFDLIAEWVDEPLVAVAAGELTADDEPTIITLSIDTDDLHEDLDAIIAKLKKIRKLQRKLAA